MRDSPRPSYHWIRYGFEFANEYSALSGSEFESSSVSQPRAKPKIDWLKGCTVTDVVSLVEELCKADPNQTLEEVAIAVVARWRIEWAGKQIYDEEQCQKKKR